MGPIYLPPEPLSSCSSHQDRRPTLPQDPGASPCLCSCSGCCPRSPSDLLHLSQHLLPPVLGKGGVWAGPSWAATRSLKQSLAEPGTARPDQGPRRPCLTASALPAHSRACGSPQTQKQQRTESAGTAQSVTVPSGRLGQDTGWWERSLWTNFSSGHEKP